MFCVIFEVQPAQHDAYLGHAKALRPELAQLDGFVDNTRYRSLTRPGWLLSLSTWRDEKALIRWRTHAGHHDVQAAGRGGVLADYHLRVGQVTHDSHAAVREQRLDETEVGATTASLIEAPLTASPEAAAAALGDAPGLVAWDVYDALVTPGDGILVLWWRDRDAASEPVSGARRRRVRIVRDYSLTDRREAPQYYPSPGARD